MSGVFGLSPTFSPNLPQTESLFGVPITQPQGPFGQINPAQFGFQGASGAAQPLSPDVQVQVGTRPSRRDFFNPTSIFGGQALGLPVPTFPVAAGAAIANQGGGGTEPVFAGRFSSPLRGINELPFFSGISDPIQLASRVGELSRPELRQAAQQIPSISNVFTEASRRLNRAAQTPGFEQRQAPGQGSIVRPGGDASFGATQDLTQLAFQNLLQRLSNEFLL